MDSVFFLFLFWAFLSFHGLLASAVPACLTVIQPLHLPIRDRLLGIVSDTFSQCGKRVRLRGLRFMLLVSRSQTSMLTVRSPYVGQIIDSHLMIWIFRKDLYGLAHVTAWEPYDLHDLAPASRDGYIVLTYRSCTASINSCYRIYYCS